MINNNFQSHVINAPFEPYEGDEPYIFISYKHSDWENVYPVIEKFHDAGFNIWYDVNLPKGRNYDIQIANHIINSKLFVTFITEEVIKCSNDEEDYLIRELNVADYVKVERFPIFLEDVQLAGFYLMHYLGKQSIFKHEYGNNEELFIEACISAFKSFDMEPEIIDSKNETYISPPFKPYEGDEPYIFISFKPADEKIVYPVIEKLHDVGFNIWYDAFPNRPKNKIEVFDIIDHIDKSALFVTFITEEVIKSSNDYTDNFFEELNRAFDSKISCISIYLEDVELDYYISESYFDQSVLKNEYADNEDMFIDGCVNAFESLGMKPNENINSKKDIGSEPYIYVSYSRIDNDRVFPMIEHFKDQGYNVYHDGDVQNENKWESEWDLIYNSSLVIIFISKFSMPRAIEEDILLPRGKGIPIIPIYLDEIELRDRTQLLLSNYPPIFKYEYRGNEDTFIDDCVNAFKSLGLEPNDSSFEKNIKEPHSNKPMNMDGSFPTSPAIYKLVNMRTGEVFVSYSKNMSFGVKTQLINLMNNTHVNRDLQEDFNNGDRFYVVILREYNYYDKKIIQEDSKEFIERENSYHRGYNRFIGGGYSSYFNKPTHDPGRRLDGSSSSP